MIVTAPSRRGTLGGAVWPGTAVEEGNLTVQISALRGAGHDVTNTCGALCRIPARHRWRDAVEPYRGRRADAVIDIGERRRMTGLIFHS